jgi:hypothetical protein
MAGEWGGGSKSGGSMKNKAVKIPFEPKNRGRSKRSKLRSNPFSKWGN